MVGQLRRFGACTQALGALALVACSTTQPTGTRTPSAAPNAAPELSNRPNAADPRPAAETSEAELGEACSEAVGAALQTIPKVREWETSLPADLHTGGFVEPLRNGRFEMTLGASLPDRMEIIFRAEVDSGRLLVTEYGFPLAVSAEARNRVRTACVLFDDDCQEACKALGQCTRLGQTCAATNDAQCLTSVACERFGSCSSGGEFGHCVAKSEERCASLPTESCLGIVCTLVGEECTAPAPDDAE